MAPVTRLCTEYDVFRFANIKDKDPCHLVQYRQHLDIFSLPVVDFHHPIVMFLCRRPARAHLECLKWICSLYQLQVPRNCILYPQRIITKVWIHQILKTNKYPQRKKNHLESLLHNMVHGYDHVEAVLKSRNKHW